MSVLVPYCSIRLHRYHREEEHLKCLLGSGGSANLTPHIGGSFAVNGNTKKTERRLRGEFKADAFWQDVSRPTSIDMEHIAGVEELDEILSRSQELNQPILIDWMAAWCRKCIYLKPKLEKLAAEYHPRVKFYFVDVNKVPQTLVKRGNISKMPTIQLWKDGELKAEVIGGHKAWLVMDEVREMIEKHI